MTIKEQLLEYISTLELEIYYHGNDSAFLSSELNISLNQLQEMESDHA